MKNFIKFGIELIIFLLSTIFFPDWLNSLINIPINLKGFALIIGVLLFIIMWLINTYVIPNKPAILDEPLNYDIPKFDLDDSTDKEAIFKIKSVQNLRIYSISSAYWYDVISSINTLHIDQCTILVRNNSQLDSQEFKNEVNLAIKKWKTLLNENKIKHLTILQYNHIPDINYLLVDNKALVLGTNQFSETDSTGQHGDRHPLHIFANSGLKQNYIDKYINHFINYQKYYSNNVIFDSNKTQSN